MKMGDDKTLILSTVVGSRLHGTFNENSDYDFRGVFMVPLINYLSPFKEVKDTHWIEKSGADTDDTAHELSKFCKMCCQGNPSALEVLVGIPDTSTPIGDKLREMLPMFLSRERCYEAFRGYSRNQEKKFRDGKEVKASAGAVDRKYKYACAHVRTLYQLLHLLKHNELIGSYQGGTLEELRRIKEGRKSDSDIFSRIFQLEELCKEAYEKCKLPDKIDTKPIEDFICDSYLSEYER